MPIVSLSNAVSTISFAAGGAACSRSHGNLSKGQSAAIGAALIAATQSARFADKAIGTAAPYSYLIDRFERKAVGWALCAAVVATVAVATGLMPTLPLQSYGTAAYVLFSVWHDFNNLCAAPSIECAMKLIAPFCNVSVLSFFFMSKDSFSRDSFLNAMAIGYFAASGQAYTACVGSFSLAHRVSYACMYHKIESRDPELSTALLVAPDSIHRLCAFAILGEDPKVIRIQMENDGMSIPERYRDAITAYQEGDERVPDTLQLVPEHHTAIKRSDDEAYLNGVAAVACARSALFKYVCAPGSSSAMVSRARFFAGIIGDSHSELLSEMTNYPGEGLSPERILFNAANEGEDGKRRAVVYDAILQAIFSGE